MFTRPQARHFHVSIERSAARREAAAEAMERIERTRLRKIRDFALYRQGLSMTAVKAEQARLAEEAIAAAESRNRSLLEARAAAMGTQDADQALRDMERKRGK